MKNNVIKYASALLVASSLFAAVDTATAGGKSSSKSSSKSSKDCGDSRGGRGDRDDRDDRDCPKPPAPTPVPVTGSVALTPTGTIVSADSSIVVSVAYTAPANSGAVLRLLQDNVVVATVSIPGSTTAGSIAFTADLSTVNGATTLQAQLSFTSSSTGGGDDDDDDCDRNRSRSRSRYGCDRDDDDHCSGGGSGGSTTTTLLSDTLTVLRESGGGGGGVGG
jgi:hypothetical protein